MTPSNTEHRTENGHSTAIRQIDAGYARSEYFPDRKIGLIALRTDHLVEDAMRQMLGSAEVSLLTNRITFNDPVNNENLKAMAEDLERAAADLLPGKTVDVIAFGCSSGTVAIGEAQLSEKIRRIKPGAQVTNPVTAATAAFKALGVSRLSVITPYISEVNREMAAFFQGKGLEISTITGFNVMADADITRIDPAAIRTAALEHTHPDAEALFLSCTALRATEVIEEIEQTLGIPVVTSNQAMAWHALKLLRYPTSDIDSHGGRLFQC